MVSQTSVRDVSVNVPVLKEPFSVVVAVSPPDSAELLPQAKPRTVAFAPLVAVMLPFNVAAVAVTDEADWVVTVGALTLRVERAAVVPTDVSTLLSLRALTPMVYEVLLAMPVRVSEVSCASVSQTAEAEALPLAATYLPFQLASAEVTYAAKSVAGLESGLLFSLLVMTIVVYEAPESVGAEGTLALVYVVFCEEAVPVLGMESRDWTV